MYCADYCVYVGAATINPYLGGGIPVGFGVGRLFALRYPMPSEASENDFFSVALRCSALLCSVYISSYACPRIPYII